MDGRPVNGVTNLFLSWCSERLATQGKRVLLLVWSNASWHVSKEVHRWIGEHNRAVKKDVVLGGENRELPALPKQSPWLNPIEPKKWVHGKRRVVETERLLTAHELA